MITVRKVQSDLKEIRYYHSKRDMFESASKCIIESSILEKVNRYNRAMINAPPRLYEFYYARNVQNTTQADLAVKWKCSLSHIKQLEKKLCDYLMQKLNET